MLRRGLVRGDISLMELYECSDKGLTDVLEVPRKLRELPVDAFDVII